MTSARMAEHLASGNASMGTNFDMAKLLEMILHLPPITRRGIVPRYVAETECDYWGAGPLDRGNAGHAKDGQGTSGQSAKMQAMQRHLSPPYWENCSVCGYGPGHTMCIRRHQREEHGMFPPRVPDSEGDFQGRAQEAENFFSKICLVMASLHVGHDVSSL